MNSARDCMDKDANCEYLMERPTERSCCVEQLFLKQILIAKFIFLYFICVALYLNEKSGSVVCFLPTYFFIVFTMGWLTQA